MKAIPLVLFLLGSLPLCTTDANELSLEEKSEGWELLFNGRDLDGWRTYGGKKKPGEGWQAEDGMLRLRRGGKGGNIVTEEEFGDFEFVWEWRISKNGNNGVKYLVSEERRAAPGPEYQMLDNEGHPDGRNGTERITAALYDIMSPAANAPFKEPGEWNESRIVVKGKRVEHWLNGAMVLHYDLGSSKLRRAIEDSKFKGAEGFGEKAEGRIMLTDHHDACDFRNLKLRRLDG